MDQQTERGAPRGRPVEGSFSYASPDVLMRDLGGASGEDARALATGYTMAIHDADSDCLSASTLLGYLRCQSGSAKELTGLGYVMAVRDSMESMAATSLFPFGTADRSRMRADARIVRDWLERHPRGFLQPAIAAVHLALAGVLPAGVRRPRPFPVLLEGLNWVRGQSLLSKGLATVAAALAVVVVLHREPPGGPGGQDLAVGRSAENITTLLLEQRRYEKDSIINIGDPAESRAYARKWQEAGAALLGNLNALASLDLDDEDRQALAQIRDDLQDYDQGYLHLLTQMQSGQIRTPQDANRLLESYKSAAHRVEATGVRLASRALGRLPAQ